MPDTLLFCEHPHTITLGRQAKKSNLDAVLRAPDRDELLDWLRHRPLMHYDKKKRYSVIHAGLPPQWTLSDARKHARELEDVLRGPGYREFLYAMYGNRPARWSDALTGIDRLRFITNCFTRLRYCDAEGNLALKEKGPIGSQPPGCLPWFAVPDRATREDRIIFGHWSTLGYRAQRNIWALDTGCAWDDRLTAIRVRGTKPPEPVSVSCSGVWEGRFV